MPSLQQPVVQFDELLPDRPVLPNSSLPPSEYIQQRRARYKQLNLLHSLLYTSYDCTIECLYDRHELCMQIIVRIIERAIASSATAQQAAASFSSARYLESAKDVARRKMAYTGPVIIVNESSDSCKGLPSFVWSTPTNDSVQAQLQYAVFGDDVELHERALITDHIKMYRKAIAAQRALIPHLVDFLSLNKTLDRLHKCLTNLKIPKRTINAIAAKVSQLDCLWKDSIPADWLSTPPVPLPKPNKDCIIEEISSSRSMGAQDDADCYITIQALPSSTQKQQEQQSYAIISYSAKHAADRTGTTPPSANQRPSKRGWGMRILKSIAAASVAVAGVVAGRNDPAVVAGYKAWITQRHQ